MAKRGRNSTNGKVLRKYQTMVDAKYLRDERQRSEARHTLQFASAAIKRLERKLNDENAAIDPLFILAYAKMIQALAERVDSISSGRPPEWATIHEIAVAESEVSGQDLHPVQKRTELRIAANSPLPQRRFNNFRTLHRRAIARHPLMTTLVNTREYFRFWSDHARKSVRKPDEEFFKALKAFDYIEVHEALKGYYERREGIRAEEQNRT